MVRKRKLNTRNRGKKGNPAYKGSRWKKRRFVRGVGRGPGGGACAVQEKKFHDLLYALDPIAETWATLSHAGGQSLNLIAQGLTESTRVGRRICVHNINFNGEVNMPTDIASAHGRNCVKVCLVQDLQANGADASTGDLFATTDLNSFRNLPNASRFKILWQKIFTFNAGISGNGTLLDTNAMAVPFSCAVKCEIPIEFDAGAGAITEVQSNNLFVVGVSTKSSPICNLSGRLRLRFTD